MSTVAMAGSLYKTANQWYFDADAAGKLVVEDNKKEWEYDVVAGTNKLGLQSGYTGQLKLVSEPVAPAVVDPLATLWDEFFEARDFVYWNYFEGMNSCFYSKYWNTGNNDCVEGLMWLYGAGFADTVTEEQLVYYIGLLDGYADFVCTGCDLCAEAFDITALDADFADDCDCEYELTVTATCTSGGWNKMICPVCGEDDGNTYGWQGALGHDWNFDDRESYDASWDIIYCDRCGESTYTQSLAVIEAKEWLAGWLESAKALSANFETAGIPNNGWNLNLIAATEYAEYFYGNVYGLDAIYEVTYPLIGAYWDALEAYNLVFAAVDLGNWIYAAIDLHDTMIAEGCQDPGFWTLVCYYDGHFYAPAYNWGIGTSAEVNAATAELKAAYWATYEALQIHYAKGELKAWYDAVVEKRTAYFADKSTVPGGEQWAWDSNGAVGVANRLLANDAATLDEVNAATQACKDAYWASF